MQNPGLFFSSELQQTAPVTLWQLVSDYYLCDEATLTDNLLSLLPEHPEAHAQARCWVDNLQLEQMPTLAVSKLMQQFDLASDEGLALLVLAEALLRIPDDATATDLLEDRLTTLDLQALAQREQLKSGYIWALALAQDLVSTSSCPSSTLGKLWQKLEQKTLLAAVRKAMHLLGDQFVFADRIDRALQQQADYSADSTGFSFDMLGEAAVCKADVNAYFTAYLNAIETVGRNNSSNCSISIKLSALCARYDNLHQEQASRQIGDRLLQLLLQARQYNVAITLDAEEASRLELSLTLFAELLNTEICRGWGGLGLAVQAYSKRALPVLAWLDNLGQQLGTPIPVRLVKGAYWDTEIKLAQQQGLAGYPVFTRKSATDLNYLVCARFLLSEHCHYLQPQFASHNALTLSEICHLPADKPFELQRLHGMGAELHRQVCREYGLVSRIYAPVGSYDTLLPYLVRRLMENGASASFVYQLYQAKRDERWLQPVSEQLQNRTTELPLPQDCFQPWRHNSAGINMGSLTELERWLQLLNSAPTMRQSQPIIAGTACEGENLQPVYAAHDRELLLGYASQATADDIRNALAVAESFLPHWRNSELEQRCQYLEQFATLLHSHQEELITLCMMEAGKTLIDALDELREAIDFCWYYAAEARRSLQPQTMAAVVGEHNLLRYQGRGIFLCISPWNFPLAIFTGQIAAALVTGNCVLAKPSSACSLLAARATALWYESGLPPEALQLIPYPSDEQSNLLLNDSRLAGVAFTGSNAVATTIQARLAQRGTGAVARLIAETGGINAMIVDSSALPEQAIRDVIRSAFNSAGQRCSALRVLYLQRDVADRLETRLIGAMNQLQIGSPLQLTTDIGPVIGPQAQQQVFEHIERQRIAGRILHELPLTPEHDSGCYVPPTLIRLFSLDELSEEIFGPVLHIIQYDHDQLDRVVAEINRSGYGLTLGIHSRNNQRIREICDRVDVGNIYINRDQVGAVVAAQPFGGMGLSGTGPKAGGPNYLQQFCREQTLSRNTAAEGGDRELLSRDN